MTAYQENLEIAPQDKQAFKRDGFLLLEDAIDGPLLHPVLRALNIWRDDMIRGKVTPKDRNWTARGRFCVDATSADFMEPIRARALDLAQAVLGAGNAIEIDTQLIGWPPSKPQWRRNWHIDWVNKYLKFDGVGKFPGFQLLIGMPLTSALDDHCGNLVVSPGAHAAISKMFHEAPTLHDALELLSARMKNEAQPGVPVPLKMKPGDIVLVHALLPHSTGRNDQIIFSDKLYFRFGYREETLRGGPDALLDPWRFWGGMAGA